MEQAYTENIEVIEHFSPEAAENVLPGIFLIKAKHFSSSDWKQIRRHWSASALSIKIINLYVHKYIYLIGETTVGENRRDKWI